MKNLVISCVLIVSGAIISSGCSEDEDISNIPNEFFSAKVDGATYAAESSDIIECKKLLTEFGSIILAVKIKTKAGKNMEFSILNYRGANMYLMGDRNYLSGNSRLNGNAMQYSETSPEGIWSTIKNEYVSDRAYFEVTSDNGNFLTGTFSFNAQDKTGTSVRAISEGNFSLDIDR